MTLTRRRLRRLASSFKRLNDPLASFVLVLLFVQANNLWILACVCGNGAPFSPPQNGKLGLQRFEERQLAVKNNFD